MSPWKKTNHRMFASDGGAQVTHHILTGLTNPFSSTTAGVRVVRLALRVHIITSAHHHQLVGNIR